MRLGLLRRRLLRDRARQQDLDLVAAHVDRLAALAAAGANPAAAFRHLARPPGAPAIAAPAADAVAAGRAIEPVFAAAEPVWQRVGATIALAAEVGAPLAPVLRTAARSARDTVELRRVVAESVAGPVASARLVLLLPPAALLLGCGFGFDVPGVLFGGPLGAVLLLAGATLLTLAGLWSRRLVRAASAMSWTVGLRLELIATAVRSGLPLAAARIAAERVATGVGLDLGPSDDSADVEVFAAEAGLPLVPLLAAEADRLRRSALADARIRATVLAARLLLPLGLLVLPAFLVLGAVPIGIAVLRSTRLVF